MQINLIDNVTMLQLAPCCTFNLLTNNQTNNLNLG